MGDLRTAEKDRLFELIASGEAVRRIAEIMEISVRQVKWWYCKYLDMTPADRLRTVMRPDLVTNRMHRLMDDLKDIEQLDNAANVAADEKALAALLDMKKKIKERMAKDVAENAGAPTGAISPELQKEIDKYYREIMGEERT